MTSGYVLRRCFVLSVMALLAGCVSTPPRALGDTDALAALALREVQALSDAGWHFNGRIAVSAGGRGGSGRVDWQQWGDDLAIQISAPVTRRSWQLSRTDDLARLTGLDGGPVEGSDATQLLRDSIGWEIPMAQMADWVRGLRAPGRAQVSFGPNGLPEMIVQDGWQVQYRDWGVLAGRSVPTKVFAKRGDASVRLVIDRWQPASGTPER